MRLRDFSFPILIEFLICECCNLLNSFAVVAFYFQYIPSKHETFEFHFYIDKANKEYMLLHISQSKMLKIIAWHTTSIKIIEYH